MSACGTDGSSSGDVSMQGWPEGEASGCSAAAPFALQVLGDSMEPEFKHECIIVIDPEGVVRDECYVMAEVNGENTFRQLRIHQEKIYLVPLNELYETVEIEGINVIKGVIVQQAGRRRKDRKFY
ncbi:MAG: S24 family peptidase [Gammaproteobacteria bacterium]|nr:S24 family peptidase [Gammaproteobacteria bacterium]